MDNVSIDFMSGETRGIILTTLRENISPNSNWRQFANKIETLLSADWMTPRIILTLEDKYDASQPPETLFRMWSNKSSYTVGNLIMILNSLGHERLISDIKKDPNLAKLNNSYAVSDKERKQSTVNAEHSQKLLEMGFDQKSITEVLSLTNDLPSAIDLLSKPQNASVKDQKINILSIGVKEKIIFELKKNIPGLDWKAFAATLQDLFRESWISAVYPQLEYSPDPSKMLFEHWSAKNSYTIDNLIAVLEKMGHQQLLNMIRNDIASKR